jgi:hypothetical protein
METSEPIRERKMIIINNESSNIIIASALGEFTLNDFEALERAVQQALEVQGKARLLVDLRDMLDFTVDVAWEEIRFTRQHSRDFERIALVAGSELQEWAAWLTRVFIKAEFEVFESYDEALAWVSA